MDSHSLKVLEFDAVLRILAGYAASDLGKKAALSLVPSPDPQQVRRLLEETSQMRLALDRGVAVPVAGARDVAGEVRAAAGGSRRLEGDELGAVGATLAACGRVRSCLLELPEDDFPALRAMADPLAGFEALAAEIERSVDERGGVRDEASAELAAIRRRSAAVRGRIHRELNDILKSPEYAGIFSDDYVAERSGRYVLPVAARFRTRLDGIVHDRSSRGGTVFIEPRSVVPLGNELRELASAEQEEIDRILWRLTGVVAERADEIQRALEALARVDLTLAKASYSAAYDMAPPRLRDEPAVRLEEARHPILEWLTRGRRAGGDAHAPAVVPIDVSLGEAWDVLVITGPNTGGKTVALKTVGLCVLMAQSGLHIPARATCELGVFDRVFADIGDEQSLQQSLSTFSSHMAQIRRVVESAGRGSLVLLDEFGGGTDPSEGAALGEAVLDKLLDRGALVMVTTHLGALKRYAYARERAENASVEFDAETLRPTFRLISGVPGDSNALSIAERLGLPPDVLDKARDLLSGDGGDSAALIRQIQAARAAADADRAAAEKTLREVERLRLELRQTIERTKADAERRIARIHRRAYGALGRCRDELNRLIRQAGMMSPLLMGELQRIVDAVERDLRSSPRYRDRMRFLAELSEGMRVGVRGLSDRARILHVDREAGRVVAMVRGKQVTIPFDDLLEPEE